MNGLVRFASGASRLAAVNQAQTLSVLNLQRRFLSTEKKGKYDDEQVRRVAENVMQKSGDAKAKEGDIPLPRTDPRSDPQKILAKLNRSAAHQLNTDYEPVTSAKAKGILRQLLQMKASRKADGEIVSVIDGIAKIYGMSHVAAGDIIFIEKRYKLKSRAHLSDVDNLAKTSSVKQFLPLMWEYMGSKDLLIQIGGIFGLALNIERESIGIVLFGSDQNVITGLKVKSFGLLNTVQTESIGGRVVDGLGVPLDSKDNVLSRSNTVFSSQVVNFINALRSAEGGRYSRIAPIMAD